MSDHVHTSLKCSLKKKTKAYDVRFTKAIEKHVYLLWAKHGSRACGRNKERYGPFFFFNRAYKFIEDGSYYIS